MWYYLVAQIWKNAITIVRALFWVSLSNSFDFHKTSVTDVFEVHKFESFVKIDIAQLLVDLGSISARNFGITLKRWVLCPQRPHHRISRLILHKVRAHLWKFFNHPNLEKYPYYSKGTFLPNLSNSFDLHESSGAGGSEVPECDSLFKIDVALFLVDLGSISPGNLVITWK